MQKKKKKEIQDSVYCFTGVLAAGTSLCPSSGRPAISNVERQTAVGYTERCADMLLALKWRINDILLYTILLHANKASNSIKYNEKYTRIMFRPVVVSAD